MRSSMVHEGSPLISTAGGSPCSTALICASTLVWVWARVANGKGLMTITSLQRVVFISASSEECVFINEAKAVAPRVVSVKGSFAPGTFDHFSGARAVDVVSRETVQLARALVECFHVVYGEVDEVRRWFRVSFDRSFAGYIDEREDHGATVDVVTRAARNSASTIAEQRTVELFSAIEIVDLQNDSVECGSHRRGPFVAELATD